MELNVERGLSCWSTRHEFVAISLLNQNVDVPYMLEVRGPLRAQDNLLKLGPLHKKVQAHLEKIAANPKLVTGPDATYETATLDGKIWQKPEVVYAARARIVEWKLEHVNALVVAYCKGALATWHRFDTEWDDEGPIAKLSPDNIERAWLEVTNDGNESELGIFRQAAKSAPNMSLAYHSAMRMYKANKTSEFLPTLSAQDRQAIRVQVRIQDGSGSNRKNKHAQIVHMKEIVDKNLKRDDERKERADKAKEVLTKIIAIASVPELDTAFKIGRGSAGYLTVAALDLQLDWHIANSVKESTSSDTSASGISKAKSGPNGRGNRDTRYGYLRDAISRRSQILERVAVGLSSIQVVEEAAPEEVISDQMEVDDGGFDIVAEESKSKDICRRILGNQLTKRTISEPRLPVATPRALTTNTKTDDTLKGLDRPIGVGTARKAFREFSQAFNRKTLDHKPPQSKQVAQTQHPTLAKTHPPTGA
ncbi:hypothetical protein DFH07DRAFT_784555 [Mycena maculata]|uniref:Uncharacterized protein n=1 Tax=Mycena maculata TaxID=230809 RepID=A0AAD7MJ70_9AGAR|nr:hypothetical protein DFH07DRAFT_784555 [Mycena maculata]